MKKKLSLQELKVSSFTTNVDNAKVNTVKGGATFGCPTQQFKCSLVVCPSDICPHTDQKGCDPVPVATINDCLDTQPPFC